MRSDSGVGANITTEKHVTASRTESSGGGDRKQTVKTTSSFDGQVMGPAEQLSSAAQALVGRSTTLTEALKAAAMRSGSKPVEASDAAAIKEVEARATGDQLKTEVSITDFAEEAVARNSTEMGENQTTLSDVIADVDNKLERDRSVRRDDVEAVAEVELSHNPDYKITPGGVAESVAAAFKLNTSPSM